MKKFLSLTVGALLSLVLLAQKEKVVLTSARKVGTKIEVLSDRGDKMIINVEVNSFFKSNVRTPRGLSNILDLENGSRMLIKGAPALPRLSSSFIIPNSNKMSFEIIDADYIEYKNVELAPSKGNLKRNVNPDKVPFTYGEVYQKDEFFPKDLVKLNDPYIARDHRGQAVWFYPVQYNPVKKVLRVYTNIKIKYYLTKEKGKNELTGTKTAKKNVALFTDIYANHFKNYSRTRYTPIKEEGKMLIIAYDDYASEMTDLINWKKQRGLEVDLIKFSEIGTTAEEIKTYVTNYYDTTGLTYLLLIGDGEQIPSLRFIKKEDSSPNNEENINSVQDNAYAYMKRDRTVDTIFPPDEDTVYFSDNAYGHIKGDDAYAEVIVGRFSAESVADVKTQVQRSIYYERDITTDDTWLGKAMGIASNEGEGQGDDGETDIQHMNNIRTDLLNYGYKTVDQIYDPGALAETVTTNLNEGRGVMNYVGHGDTTEFVTTGFNNDDVNALTNDNKLPFIFDVACVNGKFNGDTCFAESWVRATNNNAPTGAVAIIASTINQDWASPMDAQDEMNDLLTHQYDDNKKYTFGGITMNGCMHMNDNYGETGSEMTRTWTIFGDPSLILRNKAPEEMIVNYLKTVAVGIKSLEIAANSEGAVVCLSLDNKILKTGRISGGKVNLDVSNILEADTVKVTVVGQDKVTHIGEINFIVPDGPYMVYKESAIVNDDNSNASADYAETFKLNVSLINVGTDTAKNVMASLTSNDKYIESISLNTDISFGDIAEGKDSCSIGKFEIKLKDSIPDQYFIKFNLQVDADNYKKSWNYSVNVLVNAPSLKIGELTINDNLAGNNANGVIDAGETGELILQVKNTGHASISNIAAVLALKESSEYLTLNSTEQTIAILEPDSTTTVKYNVTAAGNTPLETSVPVVLTASSSGKYATSAENNVVIGLHAVYLTEKDTTIVTDLGMFYDSGKENNYSLNESYTITFKPATSGKGLKFTFKEFNVEEGYDSLYIYDGISTDKLIGKYSGNSIKAIGDTGIVKASNPKGAVTFKFTSDEMVTKSGWKAKIETFDLKITNNFKVTFIVKNSSSVIKGAKVMFNDESKETDTAGCATFESKAQTDAKYKITMDGYKDYNGTLSFSEDKTVEVILTGTAGVSDEEITKNIYIYPNPGNGFINIDVPEEFTGGSFKVYNVVGNLIFETQINEMSKQIDFSDNCKGMYIYRFSKGTQVYTGKLLIK